MTKTYAVSLEDGTEINVTVSDEPWRGDVNVTDWEAVTENLLLRAACRKCGRPAPIAETERLFLRELSMKDLPALRAFSLPAKENRYLGGDWEGLKDEAFLRRYIETQYAFFDYGLWALFRRDRELREARFLGLVGFSPEEPPELGYALRPEARGRGYAAEAGLDPSLCRKRARIYGGKDTRHAGEPGRLRGRSKNRRAVEPCGRRASVPPFCKA